tara:strand:- start:598 stop:801 length:204 start_codon:yes stop_codon:yes gene_type:complete
MYKERKIIVVSCCDNCPFKGQCKPWKNLSSKQRVALTIGHGVKNFILNDCPLPYGKDNAEPFGSLPQ